MNGTLTTAILGGLILLFSLSTPLWARTDADEVQLEIVRKEIDRDSTTGDTDKIQSLKKSAVSGENSKQSQDRYFHFHLKKQ